MTFNYNYNNLNMSGFGNMFSMNAYSSNIFGGNMFGGMFSSMGSIFNPGLFGNSFFTNCNGSINYEAMAGFSVGNTLMKFGCNLINYSIANKMAKNAQEKQQAATVNTAIENKLNQLGRNEQNYRQTKIDTKFDTAITAAQNALTEKETALGNLVEPTKPAENATNEEKTAYNKAYLEYNKAKQELTREVETAKANVEAAKKAKEDEQTRINTLITEIDELIAQRDKIEKQNNEKVLDKADGNKCIRTNEEDYKKLFKENSNELADDAKVKKTDVRYAILAFKNAQDASPEKSNCKAKFMNLYEKLSENDKEDKNIKAAYDIISKYV